MCAAERVLTLPATTLLGESRYLRRTHSHCAYMPWAALDSRC
jgi:hypothetical protein